MRHRVAALASVALLFAAGCGGGAASTPASAPPPSTGSVSDPAPAEALLPRASDFPAGWMSGVDPAALAIRCAPDESGIVKTAYAGPESFTNAAGFPALTGTATMWKTPQDAATAFRRAASPKAFDCLAREFRRDLHFRALKGLHVGPATLTVPPLPNVGDEVRAEQVEVALSYNGATAFFTSTTSSSGSGGVWLASTACNGTTPSTMISSARSPRRFRPGARGRARRSSAVAGAPHRAVPAVGAPARALHPRPPDEQRHAASERPESVEVDREGSRRRGRMPRSAGGADNDNLGALHRPAPA